MATAHGDLHLSLLLAVFSTINCLKLLHQSSDDIADLRKRQLLRWDSPFGGRLNGG